MTTRRLLPAAAALVLALTACGGSDEATDEPVDTTAESAASTEVGDDFTESTESTGDDDDTADSADDDAGSADTGPDTGTEPDTDPDATVDQGDETEGSEADDNGQAVVEGDDSEVEGDDAGAASSANAAASLSEWMIDAPTEYEAGEITFTATNDGSFPHEFVVIEGEGYESLPLADGGAVLEDELPTGALIGRTSRLPGDSTEDLMVDLPAGNYVLVCNLGGGDTSHAGQGQRLDITVS